MSRFTFVHAADLHLDTPFEGVARVAPDIAAALRDASLEAWDRLVELTLDEGAVLLLLAGDLYDGEERGVRAQLRFLQGLERLAERGIRTCIVHGNHDPLGGWSAIRRWPPGVTIFGADEVSAVTVEAGGEPLATVHGISFARRNTTENLARRFRRGEGPELQIGLLHCNAGDQREHASYSPCSLADLRNAGMDYWALGHIHQRQHLEEGDPWIVYPGNVQGRSPKPSERGAKGAEVVDVVDGRVADVRFHAVDRIRFAHEEIDVSEYRDLGELRTALLATAGGLRGQHAGRGLLVRVALTGRSALHADLRRPAAIIELRDELRSELAGEAPFFWWESLRDQTQAPIDKSIIRGRDDFPGELLECAARLRDDQRRLLDFAATRWGAVAASRLPTELEPGGRQLPRAVLLALLERAEDEALALLDDEAPA
jgi:DNA repair exonuclease SbcCD nuclease subunit